jgi:hypothetical protein
MCARVEVVRSSDDAAGKSKNGEKNVEGRSYRLFSLFSIYDTKKIPH